MFFFLALLNVPFELKAEESNFGLSYNSENSLRITAITDFVPLQQFIVTGTITDENGFPIANNVVEKGTSNGVVSDFDGNYSINVNSSNSELVFSILGFRTISLIVNDKSIMNLQMVEDIDQLDEVVLLDMEVKRAEVLLVQQLMFSKELSRDRITDVADALKGQVSGVRVTQDSGGPNSQNTISIRGATSVFGDNQPLYVVDGFPPESYDLAAADIESIDILKDASSTAIYGSRGANGVILITTKKAKGSTKVNVAVKLDFKSCKT